MSLLQQQPLIFALYTLLTLVNPFPFYIVSHFGIQDYWLNCAMYAEVRRVLRPGGVYLFVEHVAAKDGTLLRFLQRVLDPLQQTLADGCHLSRETGDSISKAGFSSVEFDTAILSNATFINPHVYGIAYQ